MSRIQQQRRYSSLPVLAWLADEVQRARLTVARTYERLSEVGGPPDVSDDRTALNAGDALRAADLEAAKTEPCPDGQTGRLADSQPATDEQPCTTVHRESLEQLSIDELRELAFSLQVPDRSTITEKSALIDEICKRL